MNIGEILGLFEFLRDAPDDLRATIEREAQHVRLAPGTYLFHSGDPCGGVALVGRGNVRVFKTGESGREVTLYHVASGETCLLTLNGALTGAPYPAEGLVEEEVEAALFSVKVFASWVERDVALRRFVYGAMAQRITELMALVDEITFGRLEQRLGEYLMSRFPSSPDADRILTTTHEHIASELGSAREVISRLLKEFERRGILHIERGRLTLRDEALLRRTLRS